MKYALSASYLCLALGIAYLGWSLTKIAEVVPGILTHVDNIIVEVDEIQLQVDEISKSIDPVLDEIAQVRLLVPQALNEVEQIRLLIPDVLNEVDSITDEVAKIELQIPAILKTTETASSAISNTAVAVEGLTPVIPDILGEVESVRQDLPELLNRANELVSNARTAGEEASKGAVTGIFSGIIAVPGTVFKGLTSSLTQGFSTNAEKELTDDDKALIAQAAHRLWLNQDSKEESWNNPDSDHRGYLKVLEVYGERNECKRVELGVSLALASGKKLNDSTESKACQIESGEIKLDS